MFQMMLLYHTLNCAVQNDISSTKVVQTDSQSVAYLDLALYVVWLETMWFIVNHCVSQAIVAKLTYFTKPWLVQQTIVVWFTSNSKL